MFQFQWFPQKTLQASADSGWETHNSTTHRPCSFEGPGFLHLHPNTVQVVTLCDVTKRTNASSRLVKTQVFGFAFRVHLVFVRCWRSYKIQVLAGGCKQRVTLAAWENRHYDNNHPKVVPLESRMNEIVIWSWLWTLSVSSALLSVDGKYFALQHLWI